jgi:hypothetical protein
VIGTADSSEIALLVVSSVVALIVGSGVQYLRARRALRADAAPGATVGLTLHSAATPCADGRGSERPCA